MTADLRPLPPAAVLLHLGPYKTGSTAIQQALFDHRDVLAERGVHYPESWRRLHREGHALMRWAPRGLAVPPVSVWDDFAAGVRARPERVCLSTEDFGRLRNPARVQKLVRDLGPERLHVLVVARAFHRLLPSHWQERVKSGEQLTYDAWLHQVFEGDDSQRAHRSFWTSHDIERTAGMWLEELPADRFTVVVTDDSDRLLLSRVFEQLLDLPAGLLAPAGGANASLSANAAELLRRVNTAFAEQGWSDRDYRRLVRGGVVRGLARGRSPVDVPLPPLPAWVRPLVGERSRARVEAIGRLGVNVVGDPAVLLPPDGDARPGDLSETAPETVSAQAAAAAIVGILDAALRRTPARRRGRTAAAAPVVTPVSAVPGRAIARELARRARHRVRSRVRRSG